MPLYEWLRERDEAMKLYSGRLSLEMLARLRPRWVISYNYAYIVPSEIIQQMRGRIVNLHASFLPWNRGASPNFWSFVDDTQKGVTIHFMDEGLDTGDIIAQEELSFDEAQETFRSSYQALHERMLRLFCRIWPELSAETIVGKKQEGAGSYHTMKELEKFLGGESMDWEMNIAAFKRRMMERRMGVENKKADDYRGDERES